MSTMAIKHDSQPNIVTWDTDGTEQPIVCVPTVFQYFSEKHESFRLSANTDFTPRSIVNIVCKTSRSQSLMLIDLI